MGYTLADGTSCSRSFWLGACIDTARVHWRPYSASLGIALYTPTVEMVMLRAAMPICLLIISTALTTALTLRSGSPMPMNTAPGSKLTTRGLSSGLMSIYSGACKTEHHTEPSLLGKSKRVGTFKVAYRRC
jgi:hypothetical protein